MAAVAGDVLAQGGDLEGLAVDQCSDRAVGDPGRQSRQAGRLEQRHDLLGPFRGGEIEILAGIRQAEQAIPHAAADEADFLATGRQRRQDRPAGGRAQPGLAGQRPGHGVRP